MSDSLEGNVNVKSCRNALADIRTIVEFSLAESSQCTMEQQREPHFVSTLSAGFLLPALRDSGTLSLLKNSALDLFISDELVSFSLLDLPTSQPLHQSLPIGVIASCVTKSTLLPEVLRVAVHFSTRPQQHLEVKDQAIFLMSVKSSLFVLYGSAKAFYSLTPDEQRMLISSPQINPKFLLAEEKRKIPVRVITSPFTSCGVRQAFLSPKTTLRETLRDMVKDSSHEEDVVLIIGGCCRVNLDTRGDLTLLELWQSLCSIDLFLDIVVHK